MGFSLGGGAVLRAAVEGVPFKAIVPTITWTDLYAGARASGLAEDGRDRKLPPVRAHLGPDRLRARAGRDPEPEHPGRQGLRRAALAPLARALEPVHAHVLHPGPPRLRLRHLAGQEGLQRGQGAEAALPRRPRPRAGRESGGREAALPDRGARVVRPLPQGTAERDRHAPADRGRRRSVDGQDDELQDVPEDEGADAAAQGREADDRRERQGRADGQASEATARGVRVGDVDRLRLVQVRLAAPRRRPLRAHTGRRGDGDQRRRGSDVGVDWAVNPRHDPTSR